jgi:glycerol-3-phosphate acyltransferase PlsY
MATALGVVLVLSWKATLAAFGVFLLAMLLWRIVSLASILAALAFAGTQMVLLRPEPFSAARWSLAAFSLLVPLLIIYRHRTNVVRLVKGEEPRFRFGSSRPADGQ